MSYRSKPNRSDCKCYCHRAGSTMRHVVACCVPDLGTVLQNIEDAEKNEEQMLENLASEDLPQELDPNQKEKE